MELLDWLPTLFDRKNADGEYAYSDAEMRDFIAAMLLAIGFARDALTPELEHLLAELARRAGVDPAADPQAAEESLRAYYEQNPLNKELVREFRLGLRTALVREGSGGLAAAFTKYLQSGGRQLFEPRTAPREGAVKGGPLGFFMARKKLDGDR